MLPLEIQQNSTVIRLWHSPTFTTWASLATRSLNLVILIPFILRQFSPAEISLWYLFSTIISLNLMVDLGLGVTFSRFIAYAMGGVHGTTATLKPEAVSNAPGSNKSSYLLNVVGTQQILFGWLSGVVLLLLITTGTLSVYKPINFLSNPNQGWIAWGIVIVATTVNFRGNAYTTYLQGINRIAEFRRYETLFSLAAILTSVFVLYVNAGLVGLVAVNQLWNVLSVLRNRWLCYRFNEGVFIPGQRFHFNKAILNEIWPAAWRSGIGVLMSYGLIQSSSLIYAQSNQVEQVSAYLFAMRIIQIIVTFAQAPFYSQLPLMARLYTQEKRQQIIEIAQKGMQRAHWTFVVGFGIVAVLAQPIMELIGSNIRFVDPKLWSLIGLAFFLERYGAMHLQLYSITNTIVWHIANGVTGTIYLLLTVVSFAELGIYAFPLSMLISYASFYVFYSRKKSSIILEKKQWRFEKPIIMPITIFSLILLYLQTK